MPRPSTSRFAKDVDARHPPTLALRAAADSDPGEAQSAKVGKAGHDVVGARLVADYAGILRARSNPMALSSTCSSASASARSRAWVALVEQLDLLELSNASPKRLLGVVELALELVGRALQVLAPLDRRLGVGRIGEMRRVVDAGALLLGLDLALELGRDAFEPAIMPSICAALATLRSTWNS